MSNSSKTDWSRIDAMTDEDIDISDIPPLDEDFFARATLQIPSSTTATLAIEAFVVQMPPVSHPFQKGLLVVLMNYNDHAPPHVHVKYQNDYGSYRIEIKSRQWMRPGKQLPPKLKRLIEAWVEVHEEALLEQWHRAMNNEPIEIVG